MCIFINFFFLVSWSGVRLSPLGTSATIWPIVPAPDDIWVWCSRWNENWQGKPKYSEETCPSATFSATNHTWLHLGSNWDGRGGKPATNCRSHGTVCVWVTLIWSYWMGRISHLLAVLHDEKKNSRNAFCAVSVTSPDVMCVFCTVA
jgi:hypothetical protein